MPWRLRHILLPHSFSAVVIGVFYGVLVGIVDYFLERRVSRQLSMGGIIAIRSIIYVLVAFSDDGCIALCDLGYDCYRQIL